MTLLAKCEQIARDAHKGQFRRDGTTPYINHVQAVVEALDGDYEAMCVAWLHDVLEDSELTINDLQIRGVPGQITDSVWWITKREDDLYEHYLAKVKSNALSRKVKIHDMLCNLSDKPSRSQVIKYANGLLVLLK